MFQYSAILKKNDIEVIERLIKLGYGDMVDEDDECLYATVTDQGMFHFKDAGKDIAILSSFDNETADEMVDRGVFDCDESVTAFLAIAAIQDNTDYAQWFVNPDDDNWVQCEYEDFDFDFNTWNMDDDVTSADYHKATPEEILEHFGDTEKLIWIE